MFFFNIDLLPFLIGGIFFLLISKPHGNRVIKRKPDSFFSIPIINKIFVVWTGWAMGIGAIGIFYFMSLDNPYRGMMKKTENRLVLLEQGEIAEGKILKCWFDNWAPPAWMILYNFNASKPGTAETKTYWGTARGPKKYYAKFSPDDTVKIMYNPAKPKINCEIYYFLNNPNYRYTFKKAGKLESLDKFRDEYGDKFEDYSIMGWHNQANQR